MIRVAIIGATGYTGLESIEILLRHPEARVTYLTALPEECGHVADIFGALRGRLDMNVEPLDMGKLAESADVALCCLPHKVSMTFVPRLLETGLKVIDFSADYRLKDVVVYEKYYQPHTDRENLAHAVFGLPELFREDIRGARLVANPGCYPTGALLAIAPLLKNGLIETKGIIVNSVTGVTGGGKNPSHLFHYPNMNENLFPYGIGSHRHMPEMEQIVSAVAGSPVEILFQPHVGPFDRGILSTVYCDPKRSLSKDELHEIYRTFYNSEQFVRVLSGPPALKHVAKSNYCHVFPAAAKGKIICFSAIDNLIKGASGQAIQNMNIIFGLEETLGLK
ncbi:MAG TPA: N-acetyl-gamma-glutamyl-phosphate reductase [Anaerohalosphaeraceae bacterium]|nr:N-acetyl-gamma-glutamyl-phosphate reductase [Anaerohalosphaeraceae bacterium]HRT50732.1 N-acetyl-gamma-glutamyl-phosphate reductase [Anaerohalosphaeraceae bacterium]HRT86915.1 N-acetyl-gamma-glutamyl-phosphate reductase [Anaerohalosphaeraceae bacterium]